MLQERLLTNSLNECSSEEVLLSTHNTFTWGGQLPSFPHVDMSTSAQTRASYWHLFNDPGLSSLEMNSGHLLVLTEVFLNLTHYGQCLWA